VEYGRPSTPVKRLVLVSTSTGGQNTTEGARESRFLGRSRLRASGGIAGGVTAEDRKEVTDPGIVLPDGRAAKIPHFAIFSSQKYK